MPDARVWLREIHQVHTIGQDLILMYLKSSQFLYTSTSCLSFSCMTVIMTGQNCVNFSRLASLTLVLLCELLKIIIITHFFRNWLFSLFTLNERQRNTIVRLATQLLLVGTSSEQPRTNYPKLESVGRTYSLLLVTRSHIINYCQQNWQNGHSFKRLISSTRKSTLKKDNYTFID